MENLIRFDWAMKRLLRDKSNYVVLEGFLSTLLEEVSFWKANPIRRMQVINLTVRIF